MHPRTTELCEFLEVQHRNVRATFEAIPESQRDRRPAPGVWSPADVVAHLAMIESRLAGVFSTLIADARARGLRLEPDTSPILPTIDVSKVLDRSRKIVAPERVDPCRTPSSSGWIDYERAHGELTAVVRQADGLALSEVVHPHPVFGPLNLYEWVAFTGAHEARHAAQITEAAATAPSM
ncbi:MAG TPA: DinB family protein [Gemmatimonadaceae bacterium]